MKTIIENLVDRHASKKEKELPKGTTIRFEIGNTSLSCIATEEGLKIYKRNEKFNEEDRIMTISSTSNKIYIR